MTTKCACSPVRHLICLTAAALAALGLAACGSSSGSDSIAPPPPEPDTVVVSGKITFDRIPFGASVGSGLDPDNPVESPVRHAVVEAIDDANGAILDSTTSDEAGDYALNVPAERDVFIRAKAQMLKTGTAPTWNFRVRNNTSNDALYALDGDTFNSGTDDSFQDLHAATGWGTTSYTGVRAAAPFAILDTVYQAKELILSASDDETFPELSLFWSPQNIDSDDFCPEDGEIVSSIYIVFGTGQVDACGRPGLDGIYILGSFSGGAGDTDEFDQHVIAHEFGHYFEDMFSRSDSLGGSHGVGDRLDLRVSFSEGWGNAFSGMVLNDPVYRDSFNGVGNDGGFDMDDAPVANAGWYSEHSVHQILWDIFAADTFDPVFSAMMGAHASTEALTSIYSFAAAYSAANPGSAGAVDALLTDQQIDGRGEFASGETNDTGDPDALENVLPVYGEIGLNASPVSVCSIATFGNYNKVGNSRLLVLDLGNEATIVVDADGAVDPTQPGSEAAVDPEIFVYDRGDLVAVGNAVQPDSDSTGQVLLPAGTYIVEVADFPYIDPTVFTDDPTPHCMAVSVAGS